MTDLDEFVKIVNVVKSPRPFLGATRHLAGAAALALLVALACAPRASDGDGLDAGIVLGLAIGFHDPEGRWASGRFAFAVEESSADGTMRRSRLRIDNGERRFELHTERAGRQVEVRVDGDEVVVLADGVLVTDRRTAAALGLDPERAHGLRDTYLYMYGLPMKLHDPGTRLDPVARRTRFEGRDVLELVVTYDPEVGSDAWTFYVDPVDYSLAGCRVERGAGDQPDETLVFEGLAEIEGLRLPRVRHRRASEDGRPLGVDAIVVERSGSTRRGPPVVYTCID